ncbi:MAG: hypothetical protein CR960_00225 [Pasteurellales bacterium]|nr:MAG: hypothetical protein CR960_00225 [Pasteurellales bacterium]
MYNTVLESYQRSVQTQMRAAENLPELILNASELIVDCLKDGRKVIALGLGLSACNANVLVNHLLTHVKLPRPIFNATLLENSSFQTICNLQNQGDKSYACYLEAIALSGDVLVVFCEKQAPKPVLKALDRAIEKGLKIIAFTSSDDDLISSKLAPDDVKIPAPTNNSLRVLESHLIAQNILCEIVEQRVIFGG